MARGCLKFNCAQAPAFPCPSLRGKVSGLHACGATPSYTLAPLFVSLTRLFSKTRLKRKDFQEMALLAWAQEVPSSNLGAPTRISSSSSFLLHLKFPQISSTLSNEPLPARHRDRRR
jgi:hypothetical protein